MDEKQIEELKELEMRVPRRWAPDYDHRTDGAHQVVYPDRTGLRLFTACFMANTRDDENDRDLTKFIADARNALPDLLSERDALRAKVTELTELYIIMAPHPGATLVEKVKGMVEERNYLRLQIEQHDTHYAHFPGETPCGWEFKLDGSSLAAQSRGKEAK
jgi:hypothetical protein